MSVTATEVNKLRQKTGAGLMDCKKALVETQGDFEAAIDFLRKKGQKLSELRSEREANEGVVIATTNSDNSKGTVIYLNSETDFVAKNEDFVKFAQDISRKSIESFPKELESLSNENLNGGALIKDQIIEMVGKIGEKITLANYEKIEGEKVIAYNHAGNRIGVLVSFNQDKPELEETGKDIAMQIAAMNPIAVDKDGVDQTTADREFAIGKEQALAEGKPENMVDKIATGKLQKFYKENTLINQQFVKDGSKTVADVLKAIDPGLKVLGFKRVAVGG